MLSGKVALVTGGGSGIGRGICQVMAREGARVVAADINASSAQETAALLAGEGHLGLRMDVTSEAEVTSVVQQVRDKYGEPATLVVNCAGVVLSCDDVFDLDVDTFTRIIDVNLKGTFLVTKHAVRAMLHAKAGGSIVNIGSTAGKRGIDTNCIYAASKGGVMGFTRTVAKELGPKGIRCNAVLPGATLTPLLASVGYTEEVNRELEKQIPLGRIGQPQEIGEVVAFVASDRASYMTGHFVDVSGGYFM